MKCEKCGHESDIDLQIENMLKLAHYTAIVSLGEAIKKQSEESAKDKDILFSSKSFFETKRLKEEYLKEKIEKAINTINLLKKMDVPEEILNPILTVLEDK